MKNKEIKKLAYKAVFLASVFSMLPQTVFAATENDLREVMGVGRIDDDSLQSKTDELTDRLVREENYNELAAMLKESGLSLNVTEKEAEEEKSAYEDMMEKFSSCDSASSVIDKFSEYDSYTYYADQTSVGSFDAEYIDTTGTKEKLKKLNGLKKIMDNKKNIGKIGLSMQKITNSMSSIKSADEKSLSLITEKKESVYSGFSGKVAEKTKRSVTIESGQTLYVTYQNVKSKLKIGDFVKQGDVIGTATKDFITVTMTMNGTARNILLAYGTDGADMYSVYLSENPWEEAVLDFSGVQNKTTKEEKEEKSGMYVTEDGKKSSVTYNGPEIPSIENTEILEDPFSPNK